jgi:hypothetical protein
LRCFRVTSLESRTLHQLGSELSSRICGTISFRLPGVFFRGHRINASRFVCRQISNRSWRFKAAFCSPETTACLQATISRSTLPTYFFCRLTVRLSCPFGSRFPHTLRLAPLRVGSSPKTRCLTPVRHPQPFLGSPLPFGAFRTLPDQSVQSDSWPESSPSEHSR